MFREMMLYGLLTSSLLVAHIPPPDEPDRTAPLTEVSNIEGVYWCEGKMGKGDIKSYQATVTVVRIGEGYLFQWQMVAGPAYSGLGQRKGDMVCVACTHGKAVYSYVYTIQGKTLEGRWMGMAEGRVDSSPSRETLTLIKRFPKEI